MEGNKEYSTLTRREVYMAMLTLEDHSPEEETLIDITDELFSTAQTLQGTQMICKPNLDLFDTMSCFEVMHPKMDARMLRKTIKTPKTLKPATDLTDLEKESLFRELLLQFATW